MGCVVPIDFSFFSSQRLQSLLHRELLAHWVHVLSTTDYCCTPAAAVFQYVLPLARKETAGSGSKQASKQDWSLVSYFFLCWARGLSLFSQRRKQQLPPRKFKMGRSKVPGIIYEYDDVRVFPRQQQYKCLHVFRVVPFALCLVATLSLIDLPAPRLVPAAAACLT